MKTYVVGGFVRDTLLGLEPKDKDYVVVGSSHEEMTSLGFLTVGAGFPVYLHPATREEYALARVERKTGNGYNGFLCDTKNVTLEEDLLRRDLTINAMAFDEDGTLIDPYGGQRDLQDGILRHVSSAAFIEDPVRVLRLARFCARYPHFYVAESTKKLCKITASNGELRYLTKERVWKEVEKVLAERQPKRFFEFMNEVDEDGDAFDTTYLQYHHFKFNELTDPHKRFAMMFIYQRELDEFCSKAAVPNEYRELAQLYIDIYEAYNCSGSLNESIFELFKSNRRRSVIFDTMFELFHIIECQCLPPKDLVVTFQQMSGWRMRDHLHPEEIRKMDGRQLKEFEESSLRRVFWGINN